MQTLSRMGKKLSQRGRTPLFVCPVHALLMSQRNENQCTPVTEPLTLARLKSSASRMQVYNFRAPNDELSHTKRDGSIETIGRKLAKPGLLGLLH